MAELSEAAADTDLSPGTVRRSAKARREAAADRRQASQDRREGASERDQAELDRDTSLADRDAAADERTQAEHDRHTSHADRGFGAGERGEAELDRDTALADRGASARERESAAADDLTGAYLRGAGFLELERDMNRARRTGQPLTVAFVDVDHLKTVNDSLGHAAGDQMLVEVANTLAAELRSYDVVVRYGGDEFVCVLFGLDVADAATRLASVNTALGRVAAAGSVTVGLAQMRPEDSPEGLVARADDALYRTRKQERGPHERAAREARGSGTPIIG